MFGNLLRPRTIVKSHVRYQVQRLVALLRAFRLHWSAYGSPERRTWDIDSVDRQVSRLYNLRRRLAKGREFNNRVSRRGMPFPVFLDCKNFYFNLRTTELGEQFMLARPGVTPQVLTLRRVRQDGWFVLVSALISLLGGTFK